MNNIASRLQGFEKLRADLCRYSMYPPKVVINQQLRVFVF